MPGGFLDPDGWIPYWLTLHDAPLITGEVARLALRKLEEGHEGSGRETLNFTDLAGEFEVDVDFVIQNHGKGLIFYLFGLRSPGDPLPPLKDL
jgi:hypothetical protein